MKLAFAPFFCKNNHTKESLGHNQRMQVLELLFIQKKGHIYSDTPSNYLLTKVQSVIIIDIKTSFYFNNSNAFLILLNASTKFSSEVAYDILMQLGAPNALPPTHAT